LSIFALFTEHPLIDKITKANKAKGKWGNFFFIFYFYFFYLVFGVWRLVFGVWCWKLKPERNLIQN
jgi:hypothetical protein